MSGFELIKSQPGPGDKLPPEATPLGELADSAVAWDYPPPYFVPLTADEKKRRAKTRTGGGSFQNVEPLVLNESCGNWDLGDIPTWVLVAGMLLLELVVVFAAYSLPHGQDTFVPPIKVY